MVSTNVSTITENVHKYVLTRTTATIVFAALAMNWLRKVTPVQVCLIIISLLNLGPALAYMVLVDKASEIVAQHI